MKTLEDLLTSLVERGGSDLHLVAGHVPCLRVCGSLAALPAPPLAADPLRKLLSAAAGAERWKRFELDGALEFVLVHRGARIRCTYFATARGASATFRLIGRVSTTEELGLPRACRELSERRSGLVLVAGPARGGRSTTLAAMVDHANRTRAANILCVEDPVEHLHPARRARVIQREVGLDAPTCADALRSATRAHVDVLFVGDLRDAPSARLVLPLASGSLVLATIHASSAASTPERVVALLPAHEQVQARAALADVLAGVVWQRLFPRADGSRLIAAHELLLGTQSVLTAIRDGKGASLPALLSAGRREGMIPLDVSLEHLVEDRLISPLDALEHAHDKEAFRRIPAVRAALPSGG